MCLLIRYLVRRARLKAFAQTFRTGFIPLSQVKSAVVLLDGTVEGCTASGERIKNFLSSNGVSVTLLYLDFRCKRKTVARHSPPEETVYRNQISWAGIPKIKKFNSLLTTEFDLMINLMEDSGFTVDFLSKSLKAKFKIGATDYDGNIFDFIIETPAQDDTPAVNSEAANTPDSDNGSNFGPAISERTDKKIDIITDFLKKII